jgi:hypothetical protein
MRTRTLLGIVGVLLVTGLLSLVQNDSSAQDTKLFIPPPAAGKIIDEDAKEIQTTLSQAKVGNKDRKRAMIEAIVIAAAANDNAKDPKMAAIRDNAIKLLEVLKKEESAQYKDSAQNLTKGKGDGAAESIKLDLAKYIWDDDTKDFDKDMLMHLFKSTKAGGLGFEKLIKDYSDKAPGAKDVDKAINTIYRVAALAEIIGQVGPKEKVGTKDPKDWERFTKSLKDAAAGGADKKKPAEIKETMTKIDAACVSCHNVFKKNN